MSTLPTYDKNTKQQARLTILISSQVIYYTAEYELSSSLPYLATSPAFRRFSIQPLSQ